MGSKKWKRNESCGGGFFFAYFFTTSEQLSKESLNTVCFLLNTSMVSHESEVNPLTQLCKNKHISQKNNSFQAVVGVGLDCIMLWHYFCWPMQFVTFWLSLASLWVIVPSSLLFPTSSCFSQFNFLLKTKLLDYLIIYLLAKWFVFAPTWLTHIRQ